MVRPKNELHAVRRSRMGVVGETGEAQCVTLASHHIVTDYNVMYNSIKELINEGSRKGSLAGLLARPRVGTVRA